jgi:hypothetical protein
MVLENFTVPQSTAVPLGPLPELLSSFLQAIMKTTIRNASMKLAFFMNLNLSSKINDSY